MSPKQGLAFVGKRNDCRSGTRRSCYPPGWGWAQVGERRHLSDHALAARRGPPIIQDRQWRACAGRDHSGFTTTILLRPESPGAGGTTSPARHPGAKCCASWNSAPCPSRWGPGGTGCACGEHASPRTRRSSSRRRKPTRCWRARRSSATRCRAFAASTRKSWWCGYGPR